MIRRAIPEDISRVLDILVQVNRIHAEGRPDIFVDGARKYEYNDLCAIFLDDSRPVFVYINEAGILCGYAFCIIEETPECKNLHTRKVLYIDDLCVDEKYRRQGIGKSLLDHVYSFAFSSGCNAITLNVWELNDTAERFYRSNGFTTLKTVLEKNISSGD